MCALVWGEQLPRCFPHSPSQVGHAAFAPYIAALVAVLPASLQASDRGQRDAAVLLTAAIAKLKPELVGA